MAVSDLDDVQTVQRSYYEILRNHLGDLYDFYCREHLSPREAAFRFAKSQSVISVQHRGRHITPLCYRVYGLVDEIMMFWAENRVKLYSGMRNSNALITQVGTVSGDSHSYMNAALRLGLYFDTICLIDPIGSTGMRWQSAPDITLNGTNEDPQLWNLLQEVIQVRLLEPIVLAAASFPIAVLVPPLEVAWSGAVLDELEETSETCTLILLSEILGQPITKYADAEKLMRKRSFSSLANAVSNHKILRNVLRTIEGGDFKTLLRVLRLETKSLPRGVRTYFATLPPAVEALTYVYTYLKSQLMGIASAERQAWELGIDMSLSENKWDLQAFRYMTHDGRKETGLRDEVAVQRALLSERMDWAAATTVMDLVKLREHGTLEDVRTVYRVNRRELQRASPEHSERAVQAVIDRVSAALKEGLEELRAAHSAELSLYSLEPLVSLHPLRSRAGAFPI
jgi:hypothetical protein